MNTLKSLPRSKKLNAPYFSQLDNSSSYHGHGSRQCNLTSCAMFLASFRPELVQAALNKGYPELESWYGQVLAKYGDTTSHDANTKALKEFQIESRFQTNLSIHKLIKYLSADYPVVLGVAYKSSGHMILATGYDLEREIIYVHDPYGIRQGTSNSYRIGATAEHDTCSFNWLKKVWVDLGEYAGWGRVPVAIKGQPIKL